MIDLIQLSYCFGRHQRIKQNFKIPGHSMIEGVENKINMLTPTLRNDKHSPFINSLIEETTKLKLNQSHDIRNVFNL